MYIHYFQNTTINQLDLTLFYSSVLTKSRYITKQFTKQDFLEKNHVVIKTSYIFTLKNLPDEMRVKKRLITGIKKKKKNIILNNLISVVNDKESTGSLI